MKEILLSIFLVSSGLFAVSDPPASNTSNKVPVARFISVQQWDQGFFWAKGSWTKQSGEEINTTDTVATDITCHREMRVCIEATASLSEQLGLNASVTLYDVKTWNGEAIVLEPVAETCGTFSMRIDRQPAVVSGVFENKPDENCKYRITERYEHVVLRTETDNR